MGGTWLFNCVEDELWTKPNPEDIQSDLAHIDEHRWPLAIQRFKDI